VSIHFQLLTVVLSCSNSGFGFNVVDGEVVVTYVLGITLRKAVVGSLNGFLVAASGVGSGFGAP
jgi:hypothetical protein